MLYLVFTQDGERMASEFMTAQNQHHAPQSAPSAALAILLKATSDPKVLGHIANESIKAGLRHEECLMMLPVSKAAFSVCGFRSWLEEQNQPHRQPTENTQEPPPPTPKAANSTLIRKR
jgi:hypothetical protein